MMIDDKMVIRALRHAALIPPDRACKPEIGDLVVESSRFDPDPTMLGIFETVEDDPRGEQYGKIHYVRSLSGELQRWINASMLTLAVKSDPFIERIRQAEAPKAASADMNQGTASDTRLIDRYRTDDKFHDLARSIRLLFRNEGVTEQDLLDALRLARLQLSDEKTYDWISNKYI